jgi:biopolymer transport protein ExbD
MRPLLKSCLAGTILMLGIGAQNPVMKQGIAVEMAVASHAVETRAADDQDAVVAAITASGKVFVGIEPTEPAALSRLSQKTVYVKADARVPYRVVLAVLDALRGKSVVLISAPPEGTPKQGYLPPYGTTLIVSQ